MLRPRQDSLFLNRKALFLQSNCMELSFSHSFWTQWRLNTVAVVTLYTRLK